MQDRSAALAYRGISMVFADTSRIIPAPLAFLALRLTYLDGDPGVSVTSCMFQSHSRDNENVNDLACENFAQNQNDVASINDLIFGLT